MKKMLHADRYSSGAGAGAGAGIDGGGESAHSFSLLINCVVIECIY